ncbi:MAG: hypothetical protein ACREVV_09055 [Steroidobacteraceae bacterium]
MTSCPPLRRRNPAIALIALLLATAATAAPQSDAPTVIHLQPYLRTHWSFNATVNGREGLFFFDTGGGLTVFTPAGATAAGCKAWGRLTGFRMRGDRLDLPRCEAVAIDVGGTRLHVPTAGIWDFSKLLPAGGPPLAGSVALDAFADRTVTVDLAQRQIIIETPRSEASRIRTASQVPVRFSREVEGLALSPFVPVKTPSGPVWMELDSGSDMALIIGRHVAASLGLNPGSKGWQTLESEILGGVALRGPAQVADLIMDGNIGSPILAHWVITLDLPQQRLWISQAADSSQFDATR